MIDPEPPPADAAPGSGRRLHLLAWAVLTAVAALLFSLSFQRWGHPIIDLGRDLYVPSQLLDGKILYRELLYNYGPVAPYLLAAFTALFGDGLATFASVGVAVGILATTTIYAIGVRLGGVGHGFSVALMFVTLSFFANSTWGANFVLPYALAATLGTLLSLASFLFLQRHLYGGGRRRDLILSLALALAALFTKAEIGLAIGLVLGVAWWAHRLPWRPAVAALCSAAAGAGLLALGCSARGEHEHALWSENLGKFASGGSAGDFFAVVAGTAAPLRHLTEAAIAGLGVVAIVGLAALAGRWLSEPTGRRLSGAASGRTSSRWVGVAAATACAATIWIGADVRWMRIVPFAAVVSIAALLPHQRRDPLLLVAAYALFSAPRIALQYHPLWYGFYLAVPGYLFVTYGLGQRLPRRLGTGLIGRRLVTAALAATLLLAVVRYSTASWRSWSRMTSVVRTDKGTLRDLPNGRAEAIGDFLDWWRQRPDADGGGDTLVVLPEGVSLNYFTGARNPTAYYLFTPPEVGSPQIERRMLAELEARPPEFVIVDSRDLGEFGYTALGVDYGLEIGRWLRRGYTVERWFRGPQPDSWRLLLLRRNRLDLP